MTQTHAPVFSDAIRAGTFPARMLSKQEVEQMGWTDTESCRQAQILDLDDTFRFICAQCGYCCTDRHSCSNMLTGYDIAQLATALDTSTRQVLEEATIANPVAGTQQFGFSLRAAKRCPFLTSSRRCGVHAAKPSVCALAPLGVLVFAKERAFAVAIPRTRHEWCPGMGKGPSITVRDWLDQHPLPMIESVVHEPILLDDFAQLYSRHYPQPDPKTVVLAGGCCDMFEDLLYDTDGLAETLTLTPQDFNSLLTMPRTERYHFGLRAAQRVLSTLREIDANGGDFPEHFRIRGATR